MRAKLFISALLFILLLGSSLPLAANPWNGKVVLQGFWWDCWNERYPQDWYTYLAKLAPRLRDLGFDGIWVPPSGKGNAGTSSMGYDVFDAYDLGDKDQKDTVATRFGDKDSFLRFIAVAHANGLEVYLDIVLNHVIGAEPDASAPGDKFKKFRHIGFGGPKTGRWTKDHWNFHPNPDHFCTAGDHCQQLFGPDVCYLDEHHGGGGNGKYMRDQAREWFVWLTKQSGADGFRFDAVKHFPAYVVEDLLYNAMGDGIEYFAVGEYVGGGRQLDAWADATRNRAGTFDFAIRDGLANVVEGGGFFDIGSLPNLQQKNRLKTVPFINNHDTWRGSFWDSNQGSTEHDDRDGDWRMNGDELAPTIDPDNPRADVAYAAAFAVDGSPLVFYEDLFVNHGPERFRADPVSHPTRDYVVNLVWAHQKLDFKDGVYKVRYQSQDLLVIERGGQALIALNDHGADPQGAWVKTDFGARTTLHDYSGSNEHDLKTDDNGWVKISVPSNSYALWGPVGVAGGFSPQPRRTTQEFQLDEDLGDSSESSLQYGGKVRAGEFRTAGSIWAAAGSTVKVWLFIEGERDAELRIWKPATGGGKSRGDDHHDGAGSASRTAPLALEFAAEREGYYQLTARLSDIAQTPTRAYIKVEYEAPAVSDKF